MRTFAAIASLVVISQAVKLNDDWDEWDLETKEGIFEFYDRNGDGRFTAGDYLKIMEDSYGHDWETSKKDKDWYKRYIRKVLIKPNDTDGEGGLTFDELEAAGLLDV